MKAQVLLPKVFNLTFTYAFDKKKNYKIGDIVEIRFGRKKETGVIWNGTSILSKKIKMCHDSSVRCHKLHVTFHMSLTPTATATGLC